MLTHALLALSKYHPVVIEGMGNYDPRAAATVASNVHSQLQRHWSEQDSHADDTRPKLIITQGDPLSERGVSAITPVVAKLLGAERGLVCLDPEIASYHAPNADRDNVILEMQYSELVAVLEREKGKGIVRHLETAVDQSLKEKNARRTYLGKPPLKDYFRDFALLQEVSLPSVRVMMYIPPSDHLTPTNHLGYQGSLSTDLRRYHCCSHSAGY